MPKANFLVKGILIARCAMGKDPDDFRFEIADWGIEEFRFDELTV